MSPILIGILSAILFGAATPASKALLGRTDPVYLAAFLYLGAMLGTAPGAARAAVRATPRSVGRRDLMRLLGAVLFGGVLGPIALLLGLRLASAATVSLWLNLELVATALLGHLIFRDYLGHFGWGGVAGALIAGIILSAGEGSESGILAATLVAVACLCWGLDNHLTALIDGITPIQSTFWKGIGAGIVNLALALLIGSPRPMAVHAIAGIAVGMVSYGVSITLYISAAQQMGATRAQLIFASAPFFGILLSATFLGEALTIAHVLAGSIIVLSLLLLFRDRRAHAHQHTHDALEHRHLHSHEDDHHLHEHAELSPSSGHSHWHRHTGQQHSHPHWPDLHHRHSHRSRPTS